MAHSRTASTTAIATLASLMLAASAHAQGGKPTGAVTPAPPEAQAAGGAQRSAWTVSIAKQIAEQRRYPDEAWSRHLEGKTMVTFAIDRQGRLTDIRIVESSGHAELDVAAFDALQRAQPFPPPPADLPGETFEFTIPFVFMARRFREPPPPSPR
jgi:protein TonB